MSIKPIAITTYTAPPAASAVGDAAVTGAAATFANSDHVHAREAFAAPVATAPGADSAGGAATTVQRSTHVHESPGGVTAITANDEQTNSTTNVSFGSFAIPANFAAVGTVFRAIGYFVYDHAIGDPTLTFELLVGGAVVASVVVTAPATLAVNGGIVSAYVTIRTTGAAGTLMAGIQAALVPENAAGTLPADNATTTDAINTTIARTIELRGRMTAADISATLTATQGFIEVVRM